MSERETIVANVEPQWVDVAISNLLRIGVLVSIGVVLIGAGVTFIHHPSYAHSRTALGPLTAPDVSYPSTVSGVAHDAQARHGQGIMMVGLLLLIATPVARVALSIAIFVVERDRLYVLITAVVLILLLTSFAIGAAG